MPIPDMPPQAPEIQYVPSDTSVSNSNNAESGSNSDSSSRSNSNNQISNNNSNVQINNNLNHVDYRGIKVPVTTITINAYGNSHDQGIVAGISVPLGGNKARYATKAIEAESQAAAINTASQLASVCANLQSAGFTIDWSNPEAAKQFESLKGCRYVIKQHVVIAPTQEIDIKAEIAAMKAENEALKRELRMHQTRVNVTAPQPTTNIPQLW